MSQLEIAALGMSSRSEDNEEQLLDSVFNKMRLVEVRSWRLRCMHVVIAVGRIYIHVIFVSHQVASFRLLRSSRFN